MAQNTAKLNLNHIVAQNSDILGKRDALLNEKAASEARVKEAEQAIAEVDAKIRVNTEASEAKKARADEIHAKMEETRLKEDDASAEAMRVLSEYSGLQQNVAYQEDNARRIQRELNEFVAEKESLLAERDRAKKEILSKEEDVRKLEEEQNELLETLSELSDRIAKQSASSEEISQQNKSFFDKREVLSENMSRLDKELFRLKNQQEKMEEQLDYQTKYMWDEYELTYSAAEQLRDTEIDNPTLNRKAIYEMKAKIKALGDVNVNAIEDYREVKERYDFLTAQRDDIVNAEKSLEEIITTLDKEMRKQFTESFVLVQERFDKVFRELFGGGKGTLKLEEGVDVLEADISVIAQPPGKKLQNMMQLSGGEKALTAISLLFAILDLRPSPFCLLDEIEAALDDSNVSRFAQYLHKLTKDTQFIVITHRRGTMAAADALYGITMQEKGVSTLVSVNLIENQLDK